MVGNMNIDIMTKNLNPVEKIEQRSDFDHNLIDNTNPSFFQDMNRGNGDVGRCA